MDPTDAWKKWFNGEIGIDDALTAGMTEHEYIVATSGHEFRQSRLAGVTTCQRCGLLPLDNDDMETECLPE